MGIRWLLKELSLGKDAGHLHESAEEIENVKMGRKIFRTTR